MLLDANLLLYATDLTMPQNEVASDIVTAIMNGDERVGIPWQTIVSFVRISTNPRAKTDPMTGQEAWDWVETWLQRDMVWIPPATGSTALIYARLNREVSITGNLVPDAMLAALAIEHGLELWSADTDFARFPGLRWRNPMIAT